LADFIYDNIFLVSAFIFLFVLIINLEIKTTFSRVKKLTIDEMTSLINGSKVLLIDIRTSDEYNNGHIANAKNFTLDKLSTIKASKQDYIITYAKTDSEAIKAAKLINDTGFENVCYLDGGINSWIENNMPLSGEVNG
tara:strand:- start:276 stop:689 length:414 start_codon:yes stop_codon:yes gene_type:complete